MTIVHIATLITPDGAFGGPVRVAANLTKELTRRARKAELWAGSLGYSSGDTRYDGTIAKLFPAKITNPTIGFSSTIAPGLIRRLVVERHRIKLLHVHLGRDLVTMPAALVASLLGIPFVVQTHGMIAPDNRTITRVFDAILTKPILRRAKGVFYLTPLEREGLEAVQPAITKFIELVNGIPIEISTADTRNETAEVLFMARMHARKRPVAFTRAAMDLVHRHVPANFTLVGPDEGEIQQVLDLIDEHNMGGHIRYEGALEPERTAMRLRQCDIYVLPSVSEPFPMSVIEAMAAAKPVIVTDSCGLAPYVTKAKCGIVVDESEESLVAAIEHLVQHPDKRADMGRRAKCFAQESLNIEAVGAKLVHEYESVVSRNA